MQPTMWEFFKRMNRAVGPVLEKDLSGQIVLIIGGNAGIGFEAAKHFARMNPAKLILGCWSQERGQKAIEDIKQETGTKAEVQLQSIDLAKFSSISKFVDALQAGEERLDIVVMNAAILTAEYSVTEDGWESSLQINALGTMLATILLLPLLLKSAKRTGTESRVVMVGTGMQYLVKLEKEFFDAEAPLRQFSSKEYAIKRVMGNNVRYGDTKMITHLLTERLVMAVKNTPIVIATVDPGMCKSEIRRENGAVEKLIWGGILSTLGRTAEEGSRQLVWAALAENTDDRMRGAFVDSMEVVEVGDWMLSEEGRQARDHLWDDAMKELSAVDKRVTENLQVVASMRPEAQ